ncbi:hypothetical protein AB0L41_03815 [Amycolatopsis mediterranei]
MLTVGDAGGDPREARAAGWETALRLPAEAVELPGDGVPGPSW